MPMGRFRHSDPKVAEAVRNAAIFDAFRGGKGIREVSNKFKLSVREVCSKLRRMGVEYEDMRPTLTAKTDDADAESTSSYQNTMGAIAGRRLVDVADLIEALRKDGIEVRGSKGSSGRRVTLVLHNPHTGRTANCMPRGEVNQTYISNLFKTLGIHRRLSGM